MFGLMRRGVLILVGIIFLAYNVVLRVFIVVCALFAIFVMLGLMTQWTKALFAKPVVKAA